ncbi:hypothetical protein FH972_023964 [Carpinus fangiana]|uniref:DUF4187 domain-containing protein n=1 Tax=Carpinus fangiana TaxID=176857 RepID=A0A5N6KWP4_9ROSI|nr:hypothetical protein FH972_023964 [Carpinus fangiana]
MATDSYVRRSRSPLRATDSAYGRGDASNGRDDFDGAYRARSPDRRRGGRGRSRSPPPNIDRYAPGRRDNYPPRRDNGRYNRSPPPPSSNIDRYVPGQDPPAPIVNPLPDPLTLDFQVGFNWFAEWWRKDQQVKEDRERQKTGSRRPLDRLKGEKESKEERDRERGQIQAGYDTYKEKLQVHLARTFVKQHKDQEWFKERYDPAIRDPFRKRQAAFRRGAWSQWLIDLEAGVFDEFTLEGIYKSESNGAGGVAEREEGEAPAAAEVLGVGDLVPVKGGDLRDEAALQPALLIKTIAPHVSREKLEDFCKEHLGEGEGGFKWLSLSDPNPLKKCHRIGWVILNPSDDAPAVTADDRGDGREDEEGEAVEKMDTDGGSQGTIGKAMEQLNGESIADEDRGNFQCHVGVHVPASSPRKKALWDLFSAPERVERDLQLAMRLISKMEQELGEDADAVNRIEERVEDIRSKGLLIAPTTSAAKPKEEDKEEGEDDEDEEMEEGAVDDEVDDEELLAKKKKLDLMVEYLRRVFNFCFFCVFESDSVHELTRKCPGGHLRRPRESLTSAAKEAAKASAYGEEFPLSRRADGEEDNEEGSPAAEKQRFNKHNRVHLQLQRGFSWVKTYEDKLFQILEPDSADLKKLGGRPVEEGLEELLKGHVKQEDEAKFRCKIEAACTKLFKGTVFWKKHVEKRHAEWLEGLKQELELVNQYVLDPAHIAPSRSDANSNGHFGASGSMANGTPRGFSLNAMPFVNAAMPGSFGQFVNGGFAGGAMAADGGGPMRRGGGGQRYSNRSGPYDRQGGRMGGRPGMGPRPGGRFADAAGALAPREAVAGRSLKSYEDLDAADGGSAAALDY